MQIEKKYVQYIVGNVGFQSFWVDMPPVLLDMHCFGYVDGDVNEDKVVACFVDEFECPGGERKKANVAKMKLDRDCKVEMAKYGYKPNVDTSLANSFMFEIFAANCQSGEALGKMEKLFHGIRQVKLGKLRPNDKISADKCQWKYNGWIDFYGSADCRRAMDLLNHDQKNKNNGMKFVKIGKLRKLICDFNGRSRMPVERKPAIKVVKKRKRFTCWNQKLNIRSQRKFTVFEISDCSIVF